MSMEQIPLGATGAHVPKIGFGTWQYRGGGGVLRRAVELQADGELYAAEQIAKARRIQADAEAYATGVVAQAIKDNGIEAAQYQVALKQVEALTALGTGDGKQTIVLPAAAIEAFSDAFGLLGGRKGP